MMVDISKISQMYGTSIDLHLTEDCSQMELNSQLIDFLKPISLIGKITNLEELFILEGTISSVIRVNCDRCLEEFEYNLEVKVTEKFSREAKNQSEDVIVFDGDIIYLDEVIKNSIILNLPLQFVCSEKCKGLCPACGVNLNTAKCGCSELVQDPRLEKLKSLLKID